MKSLFCLASLFLLLTSPLVSQDMELLFLSAPRSGANWALYCLCHLLDKQAIFDRGPTEVQLFQDRFLQNSEYIYAAHNPKNLRIRKMGDEQATLILLVRNYRKTFLANFETLEKALAELNLESTFQWIDGDKTVAFTQTHDHYFNNLRCYDMWKQENRFLLYYEDLIQNPEQELRRAMEFFNKKNEKKLLAFVKNIEKHRKAFSQLFPQEKKELSIRPKKISQEKFITIDSEVQRLFPYYFTTYLQRYEFNTKNH